MKKLSAAIIASALMLSACARDMSSHTYKSSDTMGKVLEGVVVSARPVKISENDKLEDNAMGGLAGGVAGGVAGNAIGGGHGKSLATVGGVIAGALLGSAIQSELGNSEGMEYVVKVGKDNQSSAAKNKTTKQVKLGNDKVGDSIKDSIDTNMKTELISVVQGNDEVFAKGQRVYVIYNDGRARITSAQ